MSGKDKKIPRVSIILIRESAEQMTGSGCCGKLEGDCSLTGGAEVFREIRQGQEHFGVLHRAIVEFFSEARRTNELALVTVDPRNQLYLWPKLLRDVLRYRPGWKSGFITILQLFSLPAVIVNGQVLSRRGSATDPDTLCHVVGSLLDEQKSSTPVQNCSKPSD